jgi:GT2 family glycosyltransferase
MARRIVSVAVVLLGLNGREDTLRCLETLQHSDTPDLRIILVDNGSTDGSGDAVREAYPEVTVLRQETNQGFSEGNNIGIREGLAGGADWVMIVNNDTLFARDTISKMVEAAQTDPAIGVVCPLILYAEPDDVIWYAGRKFDLRRGYHGRPWGLGDKDTGQFTGIYDVDTATGCAMLMPRAALEKVGLLDAELFFYMEDTDWCLRFRESGYRVVVAADARLWHAVSSAFGGENNDTVYYYGIRNTIEILNRHEPMRGPRKLIRTAEVVIAYTVFVRQARSKPKAFKAIIEGFRDQRARRLGARGTHLIPGR